MFLLSVPRTIGDKCGSCGKHVDVLVPVFVLVDSGKLEVRYYCPKCFYVLTDPVQTIQEHPLTDSAKRILEKAINS